MTLDPLSQPRSVSVSISSNSSYTKAGVPPEKLREQLRTGSYGSNFFQGNAAGDGDATDSKEAAAEKDSELDIVGALGNLDLDESNDPEQAASAISEDIPKSTTPFTMNQLQFWDPSYQSHPHYSQQFYPPYQHLPTGSLTPNDVAGVGAGAGAGSSARGGLKSTPSTWSSNSFIPASAPPFIYSGESDLTGALSSIKPFELPEDKENLSLFGNNASTNTSNSSSTSTPTPSGQNGSVGTGFQGLVQPYFTTDGLREAPFIKEGDKLASPVNAQIVGAGSRSSGVPIFPDFMPFKNPAPALNNNNNALNLSSPMHHPHQMHQMYHHPHQQEQQLDMWSQYQPNIQSAPMESGNYRRYNNNSNNNNNGGNNNNNNNSNVSNYKQHRFANDSMNVHRKLHNNAHKRKGDDASKYANAKLEDFSGDIYSLCKDQHGCRFLQRQLDLGRDAKKNSSNGSVFSNEVAATMIFNEIYLKIIELMTDPFGNYLIQKLFENVTVDQRIILVKNALPDFIRIALDPHGTRALQKLVECITTEEESNLIISLLSTHIVPLSRDLNGNHVVQKCLQKLKPLENQFIFDTASEHCNEIATHRHGCCVLQRCLDHGNDQQIRQLSFKVAENATNLSLDPFGNYVVQYVLSRGDDQLIDKILQHIKLNVISLSLHKFGSNVIEKSLRINKLSNSLIEVLLLNKNRFGEMLNDAYGNYVLQTSLEVANQQDLAKLSASLQPLLPNIKNTPHGRRIMTKIQQL